MNIISFIQFIQLEATAPKKGSGMSSLIFILLLILVFYFFMIRPQSKQNKELQKFRDNLKKGDKVVTVGGIHGRVAEVGATTVVLEVSDGSKITFEKSAISQTAVTGNQEVSK